MLSAKEFWAGWKVDFHHFLLKSLIANEIWPSGRLLNRPKGQIKLKSKHAVVPLKLNDDRQSYTSFCVDVLSAVFSKYTLMIKDKDNLSTGIIKWWFMNIGKMLY